MAKAVCWRLHLPLTPIDPSGRLRLLFVKATCRRLYFIDPIDPSLTDLRDFERQLRMGYESLGLVGDFIVGTTVLGFVLTTEKIGLFGFEAFCFRSKQLEDDCTCHCPHCSNKCFRKSANWRLEENLD